MPKEWRIIGLPPVNSRTVGQIFGWKGIAASSGVQCTAKGSPASVAA